jgi:hypothetical protein
MNRDKTAVARISLDNTDAAAKPSGNAKPHSNWLELVEESVRDLRFGVVQITIHEGKVVHIDKTERTKLDIVIDSARNPQSKKQ